VREIQIKSDKLSGVATKFILKPKTMKTIIQDLEEINIKIGEAETDGDLNYLTNIIATQFAFRRANGKIVGGIEYLKTVSLS
jgi:hypothetical protein